MNQIVPTPYAVLRYYQTVQKSDYLKDKKSYDNNLFFGTYPSFAKKFCFGDIVKKV